MAHNSMMMRNRMQALILAGFLWCAGALAGAERAHGTIYASCIGSCGSKPAYGNCYCDDLCTQYGDCCLDFADYCDAPTPPPPSASSCAGNCGGNAGSCWCDKACSNYGDCCSDYAAMCTAPPAPKPTPPSNSSCQVCGGNAGACWCDDTCTFYGDCCPDYAEMCLGLVPLPSPY